MSFELSIQALLVSLIFSTLLITFSLGDNVSRIKGDLEAIKKLLEKKEEIS